MSEQALLEAGKKRNPFVAKVNEQSLAKATQYRAKQQQAMLAARNNESLEFAALEEEDFMDKDNNLGDMDGIDSAMDLLGDGENAQDDIAAKMEVE